MATAEQRRLFAQRLLWLIIGPDACEKLHFPWCEKASKPLRKNTLWIKAIEPVPPGPTPTPEPTPPPPGTTPPGPEEPPPPSGEPVVTPPTKEPTPEIPTEEPGAGAGEIPGGGELPPEAEQPPATGGEPTPGAGAGEIPPGAEEPGGGGIGGGPIITGEATGPPDIIPPPIFTQPWEPGPPTTPPTTPPEEEEAEDYWFNEPFDDLLTNDWYEYIIGSGFIELADGLANMGAEAWDESAMIYRWEPRDFPTTFTIYFKFKTLVDTQWNSEIDLIFDTPTRNLIISWYPPGHIRMRAESGILSWDVDDFHGTYHEWKVEVTETHITLYKGDVLIFGPEEMEAEENDYNYYFIYARYFENMYIDYLRIEDTT